MTDAQRCETTVRLLLVHISGGGRAWGPITAATDIPGDRFWWGTNDGVTELAELPFR